MVHGSGSINMNTAGNYITKKNALMVVIVLLIFFIGQQKNICKRIIKSITFSSSRPHNGGVFQKLSARSN